ncbi:15361_t:CDS:2 [Acaulospora colombiana]|uniref:15361_t:CDS:1 n=1 Tax=Acaulospora colombiana TaxID=27376 RepID=A0ACA9LMZ4_9GLOM|nr:15361_t:CDS:2 [Acaulospora colombiana]
MNGSDDRGVTDVPPCRDNGLMIMHLTEGESEIHIHLPASPLTCTRKVNRSIERGLGIGGHYEITSSNDSGYRDNALTAPPESAIPIMVRLLPLISSRSVNQESEDG